MIRAALPFDLQRALAGEPLVTRDGREVTAFRLADKGDTRYPYLATIHTPGREPCAEWFTMNGQFYYGDAKACYDLFMAEPPAQQPTRDLLAEATEQVEALERENQRLRRCVYRLMARLAVWLDDDQFNEAEGIVRTEVEPPAPPSPA